MKKIYTYSAFLLIISFLIVQSGFSQTKNNPFQAKQKSATIKSVGVQPKPLNKLPDSKEESARLNSQSYTYTSIPFIQPDALNTDNFSTVKYNENGMLIFAESKTGKGIAFNSRSQESTLEACYSYLTEIKKAMRISDPKNEFVAFDNWNDELEMQHIKMQQQYEGIEVYGGQIILHGSKGAINKVNGTYFPTPSLNDLIPSVQSEDALETVIQNLKTITVYKEIEESEFSFVSHSTPISKLVIYHKDRNLNDEKLVWHISIHPNLLEHWYYFVDAKTGEIIESYNTTCTDGPTTAQATDLNGVTQTINTYLLDGSYYLIDASRTMYNSGQSELPNNPVGAIWTLDAQNTNMNDLNVGQVSSSNNTWNQTAVSAHNSAGLTYEYFKNTHGRNSIDGQGGTIISIINVTDDDGSGLNNAFWNGKAMFYGNGNQVFLPLAGGLDVGAHEMSHGVTQHTANLEYKDESGAINEAMSDIVGCMVDRNDWQLGEDIIPQGSPYFPTGFMRDMANPHNGGSSFDDNGYQPMHTSEMYKGSDDNGGVHINSGIINHAYYLLSQSVTKNKAEKLYYRALSNYMTKSSQFIDCRLAFEQAAKDLYGDGSAEYNAVTSAFYSVGIGDESGGGEGSPPPGELPMNPGQDYILSVDINPEDPNTLYISNTIASEFLDVSQTSVKSKPSISDDGVFAVFTSNDDVMRAIDLTKDPFEEWDLSNEYIWDNVAISKDGSKIAAITTEIDSAIWIYSFDEGWAKYKLYNPTFTEGVVTYNVLYADALEWDYSGEYLIYDAYNELKNDNGEDIDYWDMGIIRVWNNSTNYWGDGRIEKIFSSLPEGVNVGNPSLSKNSPYIMAFDYFDSYSDDTYVLAANLETGDLAEVFSNQVLGYPNYSKNDKKLVFTAMSTSNREVVAQVDLQNDKITPVAGANLLIDYAKLPVWFAQGVRNLTDVDEFESLSFFSNSYPNPFSNELNVSFESDKPEDFHIEVFNLYGQRVSEFEGTSQQGINNSTINTNNLSEGTYFVRISAGAKMKTEKVVKVR
jgi:Zn-dependent metalloprotease